MKLKVEMLRLLAIGMVGIASINIFAKEHIAVVASNNAVLTREDGQRLLLNSGDRIKMMLEGNFDENDIAQVDMRGTYGYIAPQHIQMEQIQTTILVQDAKLRQNPSPDATIIQTLNQDQAVVAYYKYVDWYFVELESGVRGFVYKKQIDEAYLYLLSRVHNKNQLNIVSNKQAPVEAINWSQAAVILPRGGNAIIEDVYTGKRFGIKRTFGTNHADVETLTKADTAIMKEIWGGFTWERRPVIVHVAGKRIAASMAGMPHAGKDSAPNLAYTSGRSGGYGYGINLDAVKGNDMHGVCDLHFRGSRKHKDGKVTATVDPLHQRAVDIAVRYQ